MSTARQDNTLLGHPTGLFNLFFAEMWERFSYYGMRSLLVFYMIKGFLGYNDAEAYKVYGAYAALVYMTPFFGGMIADRLLGARRAVVLGGVLMSLGHLLMTVEAETPFYIALGLLICGNGFFKPNISTMVGGLYGEGDGRRDGGFTIFYIGINLGAAMAPLLCGYVGETYGWHYGFGLATVGMMIGLAVFVVPTKVSQFLILSCAILTAIGMVAIPKGTVLLLVNGFIALALVASGVAAFMALGRGGLPDDAGEPPDLARLKEKVFGIPSEWVVYIASIVVLPIFAALVSSNRNVKLVPEDLLLSLAESSNAIAQLGGTLLGEVSTPTGLLLAVTFLGAGGYLFIESVRSEKRERERLWVILILMTFSLMFWAFFEQAGTSINNFTDRNIDRVNEAYVLSAADVGKTVELSLNQEQLGYRNQDQLITLDVLDAAREADELEVKWVVDEEDIGMGVDGVEIPASNFQAANPTFILLFGLVFTGLWGFLARRGREPSTPVKFSLGLLQLGMGFAVLWYGASISDERGMVAVGWLLLGYLLHTTGELCLSPVGLSMVTRLAPAKLVSTAMGAWFLATAGSSYLAAVIATFTGVQHGGESGGFPVPSETVMVYGGVFGNIAIACVVSAGVLLVLSPVLVRWAHEDDAREDEGSQAAG